MADTPQLLSLATAVPPFVLSQADVAERAHRLFAGRERDIERLMPVFANAGISTRHSCVPLEWYLEASDWRERNRLYVENAVVLLEQAARTCLERSGCGTDQVDAIVTISTTGIATPSLDARLMERLDFRRDVQRLPVFGLGCAGGVLGLSRAAALASADPGKRVLMLVVELCALTFRPGDLSKSNVIAAALFGDGAAAALVGGGELCAASAIAGPRDRARLTAAGEHTWPDSLEVMGWHIENDGFGVLFSKDIPAIIGARFGAALDRFLLAHGRTRSDLAGYVCHPGGIKVLAALESVLEQPAGSMTDARSVLRDYGNMSAATVLFVLERLLRREPPDRTPGSYLLTALGPGFTAAFQILEVT